MATELSPYAQDLLRLLSGAGSDDDPLLRQPVDESRLSDRELGVLLPAAFRAQGNSNVAWVRMGVESAGQERQPVYTTQSCRDALSALVERVETTEFGVDPTLAVNVLLRCEGPWPEEAPGYARRLVKGVRDRGHDHPMALLALSGLAGALTNKLAATLFRTSLDPIAADEVKLLCGLGPMPQALVAEVSDRAYLSPPMLPDAWQRLADLPEYCAFARRALESARDRVADVQSGKVAYKADAAFGKGDVSALGRAMRVALVRDEPWLADLLGSLLLGVSVAPTAAKTLPSQALLYEAARSIEDVPTPEALAALRSARAAARHKGVHKQLDRKVAKIQRALGERGDVAFRLPDLGFDSTGVREIAVGDARAVLTLAPDDVALTWRAAGGKVSATVPAAVRRDHAERVGELRGLAKQARGHLVTVGRALETGFVAGTALPYRRWREELADNALGWAVVRNLIWSLPDPALAGCDGFTDAAGRPLPEPSPVDPIRLWHPLDSSTEDTRAWRDLLAARRLRQPIKQAFREVYLLTPAEEATGSYSNRFAAHIVNYKQLYALMKGRGWAGQMLGPWDLGDVTDAHRVLPGGAWRAGLRLYYRGRLDDGIELASTDRVSLDRRVGGAWRPVPLSEAPAVVFSEAMRDVDLFVSVTSIAADRTWNDRGDDVGRYWHETSFGDLSATARVRRSALARILGRTRIADRCELTDRYLVVRGQLRTYRIHLGSANILMDPDSTYLCIVPSTGRIREDVFLPFEEDRLALILSKAYLLAEDDKITDPSIRAQLARR